ncbi:MAG: hypothetical protein QW727_03335 [Candidatus Pacearchaeota archaeon]
MRWGLIFSFIILLIAMVFGFGYVTHYPGHLYWENNKAGFVAGLIHGIIAPIMMILAIFTKFTMYESNNTGFLYNVGFLIGLLLVWGSGASGTTHIVKNYYNIRKEDKNSEREEEEKIEKIVDKKLKERDREKKEKFRRLKIFNLFKGK